MTVIGFDLDMTLVDSADAIVDCDRPHLPRVRRRDRRGRGAGRRRSPARPGLPRLHPRRALRRRARGLPRALPLARARDADAAARRARGARGRHRRRLPHRRDQREEGHPRAGGARRGRALAPACATSSASASRRRSRTPCASVARSSTSATMSATCVGALGAGAVAVAVATGPTQPRDLVRGRRRRRARRPHRLRARGGASGATQEKRRMRILVIGGTRFVGRHIVEARARARARRHAAAPRHRADRPVPRGRAPARRPRRRPRRCSPARVRRDDRHLGLPPRAGARRSPTRSAVGAAATSSSRRRRSTPRPTGRASTRARRPWRPRRPTSRRSRDDTYGPLKVAGRAARARAASASARRRASDVRHRAVRLHPPLHLLGAADRRGRRGARAGRPRRPDPGDRRPRPRRVRACASSRTTSRARSTPCHPEPPYSFGDLLADIAAVVGARGHDADVGGPAVAARPGRERRHDPAVGRWRPVDRGQRREPGGGAWRRVCRARPVRQSRRPRSPSTLMLEPPGGRRPRADPRARGGAARGVARPSRDVAPRSPRR